MLKKLLTLVITGSILAACSSWGSSSNKQPAPNDPTVGSRDSSDFLFGQAAIEPGQTQDNSKAKKASAAK